jgi:hypothetical protein
MWEVMKQRSKEVSTEGVEGVEVKSLLRKLN